MGLFNIKNGAIINGSVSIATGSVTVHNSYVVNTPKTLATKEYVDSMGGGGTASLPDIITAGSVGSSTAIPVITYDAKGRITNTATASVPSGSTLPDIITAGSVGSLFSIPQITYDAKGRITNTTPISTTGSYFINGGNTFSGTASFGNNTSSLIVKANNKNILFIGDNKVEVRGNQYQGYPDNNTSYTFTATNIISTIDDSFFSRIGLGYYFDDYNSHAVLFETNGATLDIGRTTSITNFNNVNEIPLQIDFSNREIRTPYALSTFRKNISFTSTGTTEIFRSDIVNNPILYDKILTSLFISCSASSTQTLKLNGEGGTGYKTIPINSEFQVSRIGAGDVIFSPDILTTIYSKSNFLKIPQFGVVTVKYLGSNTFIIWGDLIS